MKPIGKEFDRLKWLARLGWLQDFCEGVSEEELGRWLSRLIYRCGIDQVDEAFEIAMGRFDEPENPKKYIEAVAYKKAAEIKRRRQDFDAKQDLPAASGWPGSGDSAERSGR